MFIPICCRHDDRMTDIIGVMIARKFPYHGTAIHNERAFPLEKFENGHQNKDKIRWQMKKLVFVAKKLAALKKSVCLQS